MRIYSLSFLLLFSLLFFNKSYSQSDSSKLVNINCDKCSIQDLTTQIESQTRFHIYYDSSMFAQKAFTYIAKSEPLNKVLNKLFSSDLIYPSFDDQDNLFLSKSKTLSLILPESYFSGKKTIATANNIIDEEDLVDKKLYEIGDKNARSQKSVVIGGIIKDVKTGQPVSGANVYIENPRIGATTDQFGAYTISLPRGKHILNIQSIGMRDIKRQIVLYSDDKFNIDMTESIQSLKRVTVSSKKLSNIRGSQMGVQKIDIKTIKQIPMLFGEADILRAITTLPGVKTVGEASTGFNVRGGSADQNLILFNDATIYNPSHFFGLFSAFNPEVVNSVELYKSSIPANYGGRLSSVLDINSRDKMPSVPQNNSADTHNMSGIGITERISNVTW